MNQFYHNSLMNRNRLAYDEEEQMKRLREMGISDLTASSGKGPELSGILGEGASPNFDYSSTSRGLGVRGLNLDSSKVPGYEAPLTQQAATAPQVSPKGSGGGMGTEDWVGLGVSALGAINADKEAKREQELLAQKEKEALIRQGVKDRQEAQLTEEQMQMQRRNQNMTGLDYLANQRANAMKNRTSFSFRSNLAKALRG